MYNIMVEVELNMCVRIFPKESMKSTDNISDYTE